ncbi:MAG TPA: hypothetical protein VGR22_02350 [Thermomicrobiales bacterium]|nr:hypothetical protein [Thermomicrobiales bacterium]
MTRTPLTVIPDPGLTRSTLLREGEDSIIFSGDFEGPVFTCGGCDAPLIEGVRPTYVVDLVLFCRACGAFSESPASSLADIDLAKIERPVMFPPGRYELSDAITVHDRWVMASERALQGTRIAAPVRYET